MHDDDYNDDLEDLLPDGISPEQIRRDLFYGNLINLLIYESKTPYGIVMAMSCAKLYCQEGVITEICFDTLEKMATKAIKEKGFDSMFIDNRHANYA